MSFSYINNEGKVCFLPGKPVALKSIRLDRTYIVVPKDRGIPEFDRYKDPFLFKPSSFISPGTSHPPCRYKNDLIGGDYIVYIHRSNSCTYGDVITYNQYDWFESDKN